MLERALLAGAAVLLIALAIASARRVLRWRDRRILARLRGAAVPDARPRLVYFTTSTCVVCRVQQEPAIEALRTHMPELAIERHDAVAERALASEYGVLSVPTVAVYDRSGQLVTINRGFTPAAVLRSQIEGTEPVLDGGVAMSSEPLDGRP
jgi:hypothetical protein